MDTLGIDVGASGSDNMKTFKKITVDTKVFTYDELGTDGVGTDLVYPSIL